MELFSAKNISKNYSNHIALNDVSIHVKKGSIFGLLGPNGAGKTSLIRIINRITGPDSGECIFDGKPMTDDHLQEIGYLPEERGLYKKMKAGEQALYLAKLRGLSNREANKAAKYWFDKLEITGWWNKKIEDLSKGMQQKVQFAITVLHDPKLLILDEPFSGFDPINAQLIKNEILELKEKGTTVIFSTHNMASVEELCDDIALINNAKNILSGPVKDIRKQYRTHAYTLSFTGNIIQFTNALWAGAEIIERKQEQEIWTVKLKLIRDSTINGLLNAVIPIVEIHSLKEEMPGMNDIFIQIVGENNKERIENSSNSFTE